MFDEQLAKIEGLVSGLPALVEETVDRKLAAATAAITEKLEKLESRLEVVAAAIPAQGQHTAERTETLNELRVEVLAMKNLVEELKPARGGNSLWNGVLGAVGSVVGGAAGAWAGNEFIL